MKRIIIYGAGVYARRLFECYKKKNISVAFFLISEKNSDIKEIYGIPVYIISRITYDDVKNCKIAVAVDEKHHEAIKRNLNKYIPHYQDVCFLKKGDIDELYRETHPLKISTILNSIDPISRLFGNDRGTPIDRYYIEQFLAEESRQLPQNGVVIEVGEDIYSVKYFSGYVHDILDYSKGNDLTKPETLPVDKYDVFICTQVFHQIYDVREAIKGAYQLLKNEGVMLATVCGVITKTAHNDEYEHYWGFTRYSIQRLIEEVFGENVDVKIYGNCMAATAFIQGIAVEELDKQLLDVKDEDYTICISIKAIKEK